MKQPTRFQCPHCSTVLRIRDRMLVGQRVGCPDCGEPIQIAADGPRGFSVQKAPHEKSSAATKRRSRPRQAAAGGAGGAGFRRWEVLKTPTGIGWSVAMGVTLLFLAVVRPFGSGPAGGDAVSPPAEVAETAVSKYEDSEGGEHPAEEDTRVSQPVDDRESRSEGGNDAEDLLTELGQQPPGPPAQRDAGVRAPPEGDAEPMDGERGPADEGKDVEDKERPVAGIGQPDESLSLPGYEPGNETENLPAGPAVAEVPTHDLMPDPEPPPLADPDESPIEAELVMEIDIEGRLEQPILRFDQVQAVAWQDLFMQLEEMVGVPVRIDGEELSSSILEERVTLRLQNTTVGEILEALLERVGLVYEVRSDHIRIHPGKSPATVPDP